MIKTLFAGQMDMLPLSTPKSDVKTKAIFSFFLFIIFNVLKIALFNYMLISTQSLRTFEYKLMMTLFVIMILDTFIFMFRQRFIFVTIYLLQTFYILVNLCYYLYFHSYLHILQSFMLLNEAFVSTSHFAIPKYAQLLIVFIDMPIFVYVFIKYKEIYKRIKELNFMKIAIIAVSFTAVLSIEIINYNQNHSLINLIQDTFSGESPVVERYGTVVNNVVSFASNKDEKELIKKLNYGKEINNSAVNQNKPNFVIIQVESMDSNIINQKYNGQYVTPNLQALSQHSIYYPYTLSYHEGGGTSDAEFSIINSVESLQSFPAMKLSSYNYPNSMLPRLTSSGYQSLAFHGNLGSFYNRDTAFPKMGFNKFFDMRKMNIGESGWGIPDDKVLKYTEDKLKTEKQPFISYTITMSSHEPFNSVRNYYNNSRYDDINDQTVKDYYNSLSYVDQSISDFVTYIKANFKDTYIFIYGDHTPSINTPIYQQASFKADGRYFEFVPLFIITPDNKVHKEDKYAASFLDISPTILYASGVKFKENSDGENLINLDGNYNEVPFKGGIFDRSYLFDQVKTSAR
jgi:lipoteichoic acid synthase